jgi:hypothetical protein
MAVGDNQNITIACLAFGLTNNGSVVLVADILDQAIQPVGYVLGTSAQQP